MKSAIFATAFALAIAAVSAQTLDISQIPPCAATCAFSSIGDTGCSSTDFKCICTNNQFISSLAPCVVKSCDSADQQKILSMATTLCSGYGVTIPSNILSTATVSGASASSTATVTSGTSTGTTTTTTGTTTTTTSSTSTSTSSNAAAKMTGGGFVAAAMGAAMFIL